jgi:hypothetical protein
MADTDQSFESELDRSFEIEEESFVEAQDDHHVAVNVLIAFILFMGLFYVSSTDFGQLSHTLAESIVQCVNSAASHKLMADFIHQLDQVSHKLTCYMKDFLQQHQK